MQEKEKNQDIERKKDNGIAYQLILIFLTVPLSIIIGRWMPEMILPFGNGFSAHGILSFLLGYLILSIILNPFRNIINTIGIIGFFILLFMLWNGDINEESIREMYLSGVSKITQNKILGKSINHEEAIIKALKDDSGIEEFIDNNSKSLKRYNQIIDPSIVSSFAIFKKVSNPHWKYKKDPDYRELFRPVSETIQTKTGDCDDYAICLAACMRKCGGCVQIVHANEHLYPILLVGQIAEKAKINRIIRKIFPSSKRRKIHYVEIDNELWLNMDYSERYPGGKFLSKHNLEYLKWCRDLN
tara:strand:+ start:88 stop:987 length:900 start_codon:yes stop_codon:yes gene_type:complete